MNAASQEEAAGLARRCGPARSIDIEAPLAAARPWLARPLHRRTASRVEAGAAGKA